MSVTYFYNENGGHKYKTKIAIGCGTRRYGEDWIHNDIVYSDGIDCIGYAHNLPVASESIDLVYASHVLEYYDWEAAKSIVLPEWKRILRPGGTLRIAVPDFNALVEAYIHEYESLNNITLKDIIGPLFGRMRGEDGLIYHKATYDYRTLSEMLKEAGFKNISHWNWWEYNHGKVDDHSQAYLPKIPLDDPEKKYKDLEDGHLISLNVECVK